MNHAIDVSIGNHVWMGNKTIVLKGALVPDNTIVATGAIVTKAHEGGNVILAGNPARVVKEDIDWVRQRS
jgi:acetyltransferase-like isoleucine patch superfamily enzyme